MNRRNLPGRCAVVGVVLALGAACSPSPGAPPSTTGAIPTPAATPTTAAAPSATPMPTSAAPTEAPRSGWPYETSWEIRDALFAEDGRVVLIETQWEAGLSRVVTLARDGSYVDGWPWAPAPTGDPVATAALGPAGSLYVAVRGATGSPIERGWTLHRLAPDGTEMAGFPVDLPSVPFCALAVNGGSAWVSCGDEEQEEGAPPPEVRVVEPDGSTRDGWPVMLAGGAAIVGFGPDGRVYLQSWSQPHTIAALSTAGTLIAGWPRKIGGEGNSELQVDAQGRVRVTTRSEITEQCGLPEKTVYTMLLADGSTGPGWPVTAKGWSSEPELVDDGAMVIASESGRVTAYSANGVVEDGWPVRGVGVSVGCSDGSRPVAAGDGATVVVGDGRATLLTAAGQVAAGWPVTLPYEVADSCGPACTPGPGGPMSHVVGMRAAYIGAYQGEFGHGTDGTNTMKPRVMVVERDGSMPSDAQLLIGDVGDALAWLRIAPTGRVWVLVTGESDSVLNLVAEDGTP